MILHLKYISRENGNTQKIKVTLPTTITTLKELNRQVINALNDHVDLIWCNEKNEFLEWLSTSGIDTDGFDVDNHDVTIDEHLVSMTTLKRFRELWNDTFTDFLTWDFEVY